MLGIFAREVGLGMRKGSFFVILLAAGLFGLLSNHGSAAERSTMVAQLGPNPGSGPSYGYQPYNDRNPTGFYHPNGMGYGHYYLTQKYHAPRFHAFRYRKFRGY